MSVPETKWVVDAYMDKLTAYTMSLRKWDDWNKAQGRRGAAFDSEHEARAYIVARAIDRVAADELTLQLDRKRLRKCQKKFGMPA